MLCIRFGNKKLKLSTNSYLQFNEGYNPKRLPVAFSTELMDSIFLYSSNISFLCLYFIKYILTIKLLLTLVFIASPDSLSQL